MPYSPLRTTCGRSTARDRQAAYPDSTWGSEGVLFQATETTVIGDFGEDCWVTSGGKAPLYRWFSDGVASALVRSVELSL